MMDYVNRRIPPHNTDAEQCVVGSLILDGSCLEDVLMYVTSKDFYNPELKMIFEAIHKVKALGKAIDIITIGEALGENLPRVGGNEFLGQLAMKIPSSSHVADYCEIVKEKSYLRKAIKHAHDIMASAYEGDAKTTTNILSNVPYSSDVRDSAHENTYDIMQKTVDDVFERMKSEEIQLRGLPTGFPSLDKATGGMKPGEIVAIKAGPNIGKSLMALNICQYLAYKGIESAYFAYEMTKQQFGYRLATSELNVPISALVNPKTDLQGNAHYLNKIKDYENKNVQNIHIFSSDQLKERNVREVESKLRLFPNTKVVVVDYLQLMKHDSITGFDAYTENMRDLKSIASSYMIPIIVILGVTKTGEIRGTNEIEHDVDQLYEVVRDKYGQTIEERQDTKIFNRKGRDGKICGINAIYSEDYLCFKERAD